MTLNKKTIEFEYQFLKDQPLQTCEELKKAEFGHNEIAKTLSDIVEKCSTPFNIGLCGKWGSGKSTVANLVKKKLKSKKIPVVIFDVWKHSGDELRRTFLKDMYNQLKNKNNYGKAFFKTGYNLNKRLEHSISRTTEGESKINRSKLKKVAVIWLFVLALSLIFLGSSTFFPLGIIKDILSGASIISLATIGGSFLTWLLQNSTQFLTTETKTETVNRFEDPYQFEEEFGEIIKNLKNKRILIIFDNIDRVTHHKAVEVLKTIKTFLEPKDEEIEDKEVVYLIPCDSEAITKHIQNFYFKENLTKSDEPQEFLRKFFNTVVWIPDFIPNEMEAYTRKALKETKVKELDDDKISWIISKVFRQNPRQVKQFVNTLLANYLIVKQREDKRDFEEGFLSDNLPQLTKFLLLRRKFPNEMEKLRENNIIDLDKIDIKQILSQDSPEKQDLHIIDEFIKFIKETEIVIPLKNLQVFYTLRRSKIERKFPGIGTFFSDLENNNKIMAEKYLDQIKNFEAQINDFNFILKDKISQMKNPNSIIIFIENILRIFDEKNLKLSGSVYTEIYNSLTNIAKEKLYTISPRLLHKCLPNRYFEKGSKIINQWIWELSQLNKGEGHNEKTDIFVDYLIYEVIGLFIQHPSYIQEHESEFHKIMVGNRFMQDDIFEQFADAESSKLIYLTSSPDAYISSYVKTISATDKPSFFITIEKLKILIKFPPICFTAKVFYDIIDKLTELNSILITAQYTSEDLEPHMDAYLKILDKFRGKYKQLSDSESLKSFIDSMNKVITPIKGWDDRKIFIPIFLRLYEGLNEEDIKEIKNNLTAFFDSASFNSIQYLFNFIENVQEFIEKSEFSKIFDKRSLDDQPFFEQFYLKSSNDKKTNMIVMLIDKDSTRAITFIESKLNTLPDPASIVTKLFAKIKGVPIPEMIRILKIGNSLNCGNSPIVRDQFIEIVSDFLKSEKPEFQKIGLDAFSESKNLGKIRKRKLIKDIFDWIKTLDVNKKYQRDAINTISLGFEDLNPEEKGEFQQLIFDEIIRKGKNKEQIKFGFKILTKINPTYKKRKQNYEDIKNRIESEENIELKKVLITGLSDLKPKKLNKFNMIFWEWVSDQSKQQQ